MFQAKPVHSILSDEEQITLEVAGAAFANRQTFDNDLPYRIVFGDGTHSQFETLERAQEAWDAVLVVLQREYWQNNSWARLKLSPIRLEARNGWVSVLPRQP